MSKKNGNGNGHEEPPPRDLEAEQDVAGCLLHDPGLVILASRITGAEDMWSPEAKAVFAGTQRAVNKANGTRIGPKEVLAECPDVSREWMQAAVDRIADATNIDYYARQVRMVADRRRVMDAAQEIDYLARNGHDISRAVDRLKMLMAPPPWENKPNTIEVLAMEDIQEGTVDWLWDQRIVRGGLNLLGGRGGQAKSVFTCDIAARVSTGRGFPLIEGIDDSCLPMPPGNCCFINFESDAGREIKPRLRAAGADMSRIVLVKGHLPREDGSMDMINLTRDMPMIERAMDERFKGEGLQFMVLDPVVEFLPGVKLIDVGEVRAALRPLIDYAQRRQVAVAMIVHDNKGAHSNAQDKAGGSGAFVHACRAGWRLDPDPATPPESGNRKLMTVVKPNLMRRQFGMSFQVKSCEEDQNQPVLHWDAKPFWKTADQVLQEQQHVKKHNSKADEAAEFMEEELKKNGAMHAKVLLERADANGFKESTAKRALKEIGATTEKIGKVWWWKLKDQEWPAEEPNLLNQAEKKEPF